MLQVVPYFPASTGSHSTPLWPDHAFWGLPRFQDQKLISCAHPFHLGPLGRTDPVSAWVTEAFPPSLPSSQVSKISSGQANQSETQFSFVENF